jgi:hypothetical protein
MSIVGDGGGGGGGGGGDEDDDGDKVGWDECPRRRCRFGCCGRRGEKISDPAWAPKNMSAGRSRSAAQSASSNIYSII